MQRHHHFVTLARKFTSAWTWVEVRVVEKLAGMMPAW
jgi:hypothetical protein